MRPGCVPFPPIVHVCIVGDFPRPADVVAGTFTSPGILLALPRPPIAPSESHGTEPERHDEAAVASPAPPPPSDASCGQCPTSGAFPRGASRRRPSVFGGGPPLPPAFFVVPSGKKNFTFWLLALASRDLETHLLLADGRPGGSCNHRGQPEHEVNPGWATFRGPHMAA